MKTKQTIPQIIRHVTLVGVAVNIVLTVVKIVVGYTGHSDALVADGIHSLSDFASDLIVLLFVAQAYKSVDEDHPYGHGKFETFASLLIAVALIAVGIALAAGGITSIIGVANGIRLPVPSIWTMLVAVLSIASKEWLFHYTRRAARRLKSSSLEANAWHHRTDAMSSIATLAGVSAGIIFGQRWCILDPIATIAIAVLIVLSALKIATPSVNELLEKSPGRSDMEAIEQSIRMVDGVKDFHHLRARHNGNRLIVDVHIKVDGNLTVVQGHRIATAVEESLKKCFGASTISNVHIEPYTGNQLK